MRRLFEGAGFTIVEQHRVRRPLSEVVNIDRWDEFVSS
jgi:hypothetical protein